VKSPALCGLVGLALLGAPLGCASKPKPAADAWSTNADGDPSIADKVSGYFKTSSAKAQAAAVAAADPDDPVRLGSSTPKPGPDLHVAMAHVKEHGGDFVDAERHYQEALRQAPADLPALVGYAHLKDHLGQLDQATALYQQAAIQHPRQASVHNDLGLCLHRRGLLKESIASLHAAVDLAPDKKLYRNNLATALVDAGRPVEAYQQLAAAHGEAVAHYNLGYLLASKGDHRQAAAEYQRALALDPSLSPAREALAQLTPAPQPAVAVAQAPPRAARAASAPPPAAAPAIAPAAVQHPAPEPRPQVDYLQPGSAPSGRAYPVQFPAEPSAPRDDPAAALPPLPTAGSIAPLPPVE
jgi:Tfp pilus assembly protein PilF